MDWRALLEAGSITLAAAIFSYVLVVGLRPWLVVYALVPPNARSSHSEPTPQGAGIAVVASMALVVGAAALLGLLDGAANPHWLKVVIALVGLAAIGAYDDIKPLPVAPRLAVQVACAALLVNAVSAAGGILGLLPAWLEIVLLVLGLVWFINLTNFMDGIDWMSVVEFVPVGLFVGLFTAIGDVPMHCGLAGLALAGAIIGFAPHNRHVARVFMGDVGSFAIGGLTGWMLIEVAAAGHLAAALLLPMYYVADSTITLWRRYQRGENLSEAHRSHFYQLAYQRGLSVPAITDRVLGLNILLGLLGALTIAVPGFAVAVLALVAGSAATGGLLAHFERGGA